ncbi:hypothetical protein IAS59_000237 [Cryptococcus gattii]
MFGPATIIFSISVFFFFSGVIAANKDDQCLSACSDWSVVLGYCRGQYIESTVQQFNLTYMNNFVGCLCEGQTYTGALGNETIMGSAGICASCQKTPALIQKNIQDFLQLCSVQSTNGTASNSTAFRPQSYETAEDTSKDAVVGKGVQTLVNNATWLCWMGTFLTAFFSSGAMTF